MPARHALLFTAVRGVTAQLDSGRELGAQAAGVEAFDGLGAIELAFDAPDAGGGLQRGAGPEKREVEEVRERVVDG